MVDQMTTVLQVVRYGLSRCIHAARILIYNLHVLHGCILSWNCWNMQSGSIPPGDHLQPCTDQLRRWVVVQIQIHKYKLQNTNPSVLTKVTSRRWAGSSWTVKWFASKVQRVIVFFYELDNTIGAEMRCLMQWSACSFMRCKDALVSGQLYVHHYASVLCSGQCYALLRYNVLFSVMFCCVMHWSVLCSGVLCAGQCIPSPLPSRYRPLKASHCAPLDCTAPGWTSMPYHHVHCVLRFVDIILLCGLFCV